MVCRAMSKGDRTSGDGFTMPSGKGRETLADKEIIVERRSGSGIGFALLAIAIIIAAVVAFAFLRNDNAKTDAVTGAAQSVSHAADQAGAAVNPNK